jgi:DNA repair photolyase
LSFLNDPYAPLNQKKQLTREVIQILRQNHIPFQVLTKSCSAAWDFDLYGARDAFAVTLTLLDKRWKQWESKATEPEIRMVTLQQAKMIGIETWVSLEPVIDPEQSLKIIEETHDYVDLYKIGTLNYVTPPSSIDWRAFGREAIALCERFSKPYWIKSDLAQHLGGISFHNTDNRRCNWSEK